MLICWRLQPVSLLLLLPRRKPGPTPRNWNTVTEHVFVSSFYIYIYYIFLFLVRPTCDRLSWPRSPFLVYLPDLDLTVHAIIHSRQLAISLCVIGLVVIRQLIAIVCSISSVVLQNWQNLRLPKSKKMRAFKFDAKHGCTTTSVQNSFYSYSVALLIRTVMLQYEIRSY